MGIRLGDAKSHLGVPIVWVDDSGQAAAILAVGDVVIEINGKSVRGKSSKDAGVYVKQSELVKLTMGDKNETAADARRIAKEKVAADKQRIKDEKAKEKQRVADEKAALKKRIVDEKIAKKLQAAEAKQKIIDEKMAETKKIAEEKERQEDEKIAEKARIAEEKLALRQRVEDTKMKQESAAAPGANLAADATAPANPEGADVSESNKPGLSVKRDGGDDSDGRDGRDGHDEDESDGSKANVPHDGSTSTVEQVVATSSPVVDPSSARTNVDDGMDPLSSGNNEQDSVGSSSSSASPSQFAEGQPTMRGAPGSIVVLDRQNGKKIGIRLGDARPSCGVPIVWVSEDGQAVGKLVVGDVVVAINGKNVRSATSRDAGKHVKLAELVELTLGDPQEDPVAAKKIAKEAAAAERQRIKDEKAAEKKRIADQKTALRQRMAEEKLAKKLEAADAKAAAKLQAAEDRAAAKAARNAEQPATPPNPVPAPTPDATAGAKHGLGALVDSGMVDLENAAFSTIENAAPKATPKAPPPNMPLCPKMGCGAQMPKIYYMGGIYSQGWFCDECGASSHKLPNGSPRHSCERCRMDFCEACASSYSTAAMEAAVRAAAPQWSCEYCSLTDTNYDTVVAHEISCTKRPSQRDDEKEGADENMVWRCEHCDLFGKDFDVISQHEITCAQQQEQKKAAAAKRKAAREAAPLLGENDDLSTIEPAPLQTPLPAAPASGGSGNNDGARDSDANCADQNGHPCADLENEMGKVLATASKLMERTRRADAGAVSIAAAKEAAAAAANVPKGPPSKPDDNASDIAAGIGSQSDALRARATALLKMLAAASDA